MKEEVSTEEADARALTLKLSRRAPHATICPSEVAKALASRDDWRDAMPVVHARSTSWSMRAVQR